MIRIHKVHLVILHSFIVQYEPSVYVYVAAVWFQLYGTFEIVISFLKHFQINQSLSKTVRKTLS